MHVWVEEGGGRTLQTKRSPITGTCLIWKTTTLMKCRTSGLRTETRWRSMSTQRRSLCASRNARSKKTARSVTSFWKLSVGQVQRLWRASKWTERVMRLSLIRNMSMSSSKDTANLQTRTKKRFMPHDTVSFNGNRILSFYKDAKTLRAGGMVIPRMISCWLTHVCNLNCSYCLYTESHNVYKDLGDTEKFMRFIDEISELGVEGIQFGGGGEPTVHKDCFKIAKYAKDKGMQVGMLTNAARFDIPLALESFRYIRLGIDAHTDELYQQVKGTKPGVFAKTEANCRELIGARNKSGNRFPRIGVKHLIGKKNVRSEERRV